MTENGVKVGDCPSCGYVHGESVNLNFPNSPTCNDCGEELNKAKVVPQSEFDAAT